MCSLNIERNIFIVFCLLCNKFFSFYNIEVYTLHIGQILELGFFACFAFSLLLSWPVNIFPQYLPVEEKATLLYFFTEIESKWFQQLS